MNACYAALLLGSGVHKYFGVFETKQEAWEWINEQDPYRQETWTVIYIENKERVLS